MKNLVRSGLGIMAAYGILALALSSVARPQDRIPLQLNLVLNAEITSHPQIEVIGQGDLLRLTDEGAIFTQPQLGANESSIQINFGGDEYFSFALDVEVIQAAAFDSKNPMGLFVVAVDDAGVEQFAFGVNTNRDQSQSVFARHKNLLSG